MLILFAAICFFSVVVFVIVNVFVVPKKYDRYIEKYAKKYEIDEHLVCAIINVESGFDKNAESRVGAMGLMQLMPTTAEWIASELDVEFRKEMLFDAKTNIEFGCFYLRYLTDKFGDVWTVVAAYNAGETVVRKWLGENGVVDESKIEYKETKAYVEKVRKFYKLYKNGEMQI